MSEAFGQMLRRLRVERGLSQNQLARVAGIDPAYVNRLERAGERRPDGALIVKHTPGRDIILALGVALDMSYAERDRLLYVAGLAPETDWQERCEDVEAALQTVRGAVEMLARTVEEPTAIRSRVG